MRPTAPHAVTTLISTILLELQKDACCLQRVLQQANQKRLPVALGFVLVVLVVLSLPGTPGLPHRGITPHCIYSPTL